MTPSLSFSDLCDHRPGNSKPFCQVFKKGSIWVRSNQPNVIFRELACMVSFAFSPPVVSPSGGGQSDCVGVLQIFGSGGPFKVFKSVVKRVAVDVVDIKAGAWTQERLSHKPMDGPRVASAKEHRPVVALGARKASFHQPVAKDSPLTVNGIAPFEAWNVGPVRLEGVH